MIRFEFEGNVYFITKTGVVDEHYCLLNDAEGLKVACAYYSSVPYHELSEDDLLDYVRQSAKAGAFKNALAAYEYGIKKYSLYSFGKSAMPTIAAGYRRVGQPEKAIEFAKRYIRDSDLCSVPLLTSMAAAFCDVGDLDNAKKYCNLAYALQGGGPGYKNELSLVYCRIEKLENRGSRGSK